jgi:hypothetical protein
MHISQLEISTGREECKNSRSMGEIHINTIYASEQTRHLRHVFGLEHMLFGHGSTNIPCKLLENFEISNPEPKLDLSPQIP